MQARAQSKPGRRRRPENIRMCLGCRERGTSSQLVRFVAGPDGDIAVDLRQKLPGRGAYLHLKHSCAASALKRRAFKQAIGVTIDAGRTEELMVRMRGALEKRLRERLGLARRAGAVVLGTERVRRSMREDEAHLVLLATDASEGTRKQLEANSGRKNITVLSVLRGNEMGQAVGLDFLAAIAITREPFSTELLQSSRCLQGPGSTQV